MMREGEVLFLNSLMAGDWQGEVCGSRKFEFLHQKISSPNIIMKHEKPFYFSLSGRSA